MRILRTEAHRRIAILIAEKSMHRRFIGACARAVGCIPVGRALDSAKPGSGTVYLPDPANDPLLLRGVGTNFEKEAQVGGLIVLPYINGAAANADIAEIIGPEEVRLKKAFKGRDAYQQLTGRTDIEDGGKLPDGSTGHAMEGYKGVSYKTAPKVDQTLVYNAVFDRLDHGGCICIFPEGGSHDRTELLPLKRR
jgi:glycerol-3-phosphate O-acyltransferase/dihydroxyacetone phosphate acyltransferase